MQASPAEHRRYLWQVPGQRVSVDISLDAVDRLAATVAEGLAVEGRGIEVGGLLLGRVVRRGGQTVVEVEDFEPIECEHLAGPSFMLSAGDRNALEARLRRHRAGALPVAGFFRSNTRKEYVATIEDVALMSAYFADPAQVFFLIQAERGAISGGFLVWEGRRIRSQRPPLEFPLSSAVLAEESHPAPPPVVVAAPPAAVEAEAPRRRRSRHAGWLAAVAAVTAVTAGVLYDGSRTRVQQTPAKVQSSKVQPSKIEQPVSSRVSEVRPETPPTSAPQPLADAAPTVTAPPREAVTAPPPAIPREAVTAPTPAPPRAAVAAPPPAPVASTPPENRADRKIVERPAVTAFRPPPAPAPVIRPTIVDPPQLDAVPKSAPAQVSGLRELVRPPAPPPAAAAPPPTPTPRPFVTVAADPAPRTTGSRFSFSARRNRDAKFVPPAPVRSNVPDVSPDLRRRVAGQVLINVRVYVNQAGKVEFAELLSDGTGANRDLAALAVFSSRRWQFSPANLDGKAVPSEVILRYQFGQGAQ